MVEQTSVKGDRMDSNFFIDGEWDIRDWAVEAPYCSRPIVTFTVTCIPNGLYKLNYDILENTMHMCSVTPDMYRVLDKCQSCIQHFLDGKWDDVAEGEAENLLIEIETVLKKARGEK